MSDDIPCDSCSLFILCKSKVYIERDKYRKEEWVRTEEWARYWSLEIIRSGCLLVSNYVADHYYNCHSIIEYFYKGEESVT